MITKLKFFDANLYVGKSLTGNYKPATSSKQLIKMLDDIGIEKALVWHISQRDYDSHKGNETLIKFIEGEKRLFGCWTILPPQTREMPQKKEFFKLMKQNRIFALRVFPNINNHRFLLNRVVFGKLLDEICERKIPLMLSIENGISWEEIYSILKEYPNLVCVLCDTGVWPTDRYFRPLIETYSNVYIETSLISIGDGIMEKLVCEYGSKRLLFGSGFPERIPEASMLQLIHSNISNKDKEKIASKNIEKLISEVKL